MTVDELLESGLAELVRGSVRVRDGDEYVVIARQNGDMMAVTEAGRAFLARASTSLDDVAAPAKAKRKPPVKGPVLDDTDDDYFPAA